MKLRILSIALVFLASNLAPANAATVTDKIVYNKKTVVTRWRLTGTHLGEYLGKEATGNKVDVDGVSIDRIKGGMVVSGFDAWDSLGFREQIGLIPKT